MRMAKLSRERVDELGKLAYRPPNVCSSGHIHRDGGDAALCDRWEREHGAEITVRDWFDQLRTTADDPPARVTFNVERLPDGRWLAMATVMRDGKRLEARKIFASA